MNHVVLIGRLTKDVEVRYTSGNEPMAVAKFTLAVDRPFTREKQTDFIRIVVFGKQAENCERYLAKGSQVGIQGRIQTGSYEKQDGTKVYTTDVMADRVEFLGGKSDAAKTDRIPDIPGGYQGFIEDDDPF